MRARARPILTSADQQQFLSPFALFTRASASPIRPTRRMINVISSCSPLATCALGYYVGCGPIRYCYVQISQDGSRLHRCVYACLYTCMYVCGMWVCMWACGYVAGFSLLQRDKILSSCDHLVCVCVSFTPGECKSLLQDLLHLLWP